MQGANSHIAYYNTYITKTVTDDEAYDEPLESAAYREAYLQTLFKYAYPHVPEVYSVQRKTITMQRVTESVSLEKYLMLNPYRVSRSLLLEKVETIIKALSKSRILHRDVTYENILVDVKENLWLIDFGRARKYQENDDLEEMEDWDRDIFVDTLGDLIDSGLAKLTP